MTPRYAVSPSRRARARRRRAARLTMTVLTSCFLLVLFWGGGLSGRSAASRDHAPRRITVKAGDTLWNVAERFAPEGVDPRAYVDALVSTNELRGSLYAGQRIRLPE